jgi:hypothetical protein
LAGYSAIDVGLAWKRAIQLPFLGDGVAEKDDPIFRGLRPEGDVVARIPPDLVPVLQLIGQLLR